MFYFLYVITFALQYIIFIKLFFSNSLELTRLIDSLRLISETCNIDVSQELQILSNSYFWIN